LWFGISVSIFIIVSGLVLVYDPSRARLAQLALALQITYFSSPLLGWRMICGVGLSTVMSAKPIEGLTLVGGNVWIKVQLGAKWTFSYLDQQTLGIGINLVGLFLFMVLRYSTRTVNPTATRVVR
jgi:hypothetical protein